MIMGTKKKFNQRLFFWEEVGGEGAFVGGAGRLVAVTVQHMHAAFLIYAFAIGNLVCYVTK